MVNMPLFTGFYTFQVVVWDFFHQQYVVEYWALNDQRTEIGFQSFNMQQLVFNMHFPMWPFFEANVRPPIFYAAFSDHCHINSKLFHAANATLIPGYSDSSTTSPLIFILSAGCGGFRLVCREETLQLCSSFVTLLL